MQNGKIFIKKNTIISTMLFFIWFPPVLFVDTYSIWYNLVKIFLCTYIILQFFFKNKNKFVLYPLLMFLGTLVYSTYCQGDNKNFLLSIVYSLGIFSIFCYFDGQDLFSRVKSFFPITTLYFIINVIIIVFLKNGVSQDNWGRINYFVGGKFSVMYLSLVWFVQLYIIKYGKFDRFKLIIIFAIFLLISVLTDSSTAATCFIILFIILYSKKIKNVLFNPYIFIFLIILLNLLIVVYNGFLQSGVISYIVKTILNRNLDLTGRTDIFKEFFVIIRNNLMLGKGYNNSNWFYSSIGFANAQNGFLDIISKAGLLGLFFFIITLIIGIFQCYYLNNSYYMKNCIWPVLITFFIAALVEISFNEYYYFVFAMLLSKTKFKLGSQKIYGQKIDIT